MTEYGTGCLVRSLAGHDKGTYYIIVREDAHYVYLADGRTKTAAKPKRKKRKHVQFSHKWDEALAAQFADGAVTGKDLIQAGIQPGPALGKTLHLLFEKVLENPAWNEKERLLAEVEVLKQSQNAKTSKA